MAKLTRREFLKQTAKGTAATVAGLTAIDNLLSPEQAQAAPPNNGTSNAKNAGSVISLPKGGGAVKGIGETFKPNRFTPAFTAKSPKCPTTAHLCPGSVSKIGLHSLLWIQ